LSVRQLQRRFLNATGLTPKQFARVQRWRATAIKLAGDTESKLVDCAAELGFTDQAHLSRECASLTGRSPKSFTEKVRQIEHGNLV
jgi:AraC-like DNA-binding protein